jgi:LysR family transcriptional regulator, nod-box dependent transcriptional activator
MLLRQHNLNFIPILRELLRTQSVGRTAEIVGLSPSGVSAALARLRETFEDELLVTVGRTLKLTERGAALIEQTERVCVDLELLLQSTKFDPSTSTNTFVIASADYTAFLLAPKVTALLGREAPKACVRFIDIPINYSGELSRGAVDVIVASRATTLQLAPWTSSATLFEDEMVVIASTRHRSFKGKLTRAIYESCSHVTFQMPTPTRSEHESTILSQLGIEQRNRVTVQQFLALPAIVQSSDCLALLQRRLADAFVKSYDIEILDSPFEIPRLVLTAHWRTATDKDPASLWFRSLLRRSMPSE